jgi:amidohydrolase
MIREGVLDNPRVDAAFALHVEPQLEVGRVGCATGTVFASGDRFVIEIVGRPAHGAYPHTGIDPIPIAAETVRAAQTLVARGSEAEKGRVLTIGTIRGGERGNLVAERVRMEGILRVLGDATRADLKERLAMLVSGIAASHGAQGTVRFVGAGVPATVNDAGLVRRLVPALRRALGGEAVVESGAQMGTEDFALVAARVPSLYLRLGVRAPGQAQAAGVHSEDFDLDESALPIGVRALTTLAWEAAR